MWSCCRNYCERLESQQDVIAINFKYCFTQKCKQIRRSRTLHAKKRIRFPGNAVFGVAKPTMSVLFWCRWDRIGSVGRLAGTEYQYDRMFSATVAFSSGCFWNLIPESLMFDALNILNGSDVVQLLDSWTNTSSSIKLAMASLQPGLYFASSLQNSQNKYRH